MPLLFHPDSGIILICDFRDGVPPEMVKQRPVLVVSPRSRGHGLVTVVPMSETAPLNPQPWHVAVPPGVYPIARGPMWFKCDMLATVGLARLDRVRVGRNGSARQYQAPVVTPELLARVRRGVAAALGLD